MKPTPLLAAAAEAAFARAAGPGWRHALDAALTPLEAVAVRLGAGRGAASKAAAWSQADAVCSIFALAGAAGGAAWPDLDALDAAAEALAGAEAEREAGQVSIDRDGNRTRTSIPVSSILGFEDAYFRAAALVPEGDAIHAYALGPDPENPAEEIALVVAARGGAQQ